MSEQSPLQARLTLAGNGYSTIPVNGKIPHIRGWQTWHHRKPEVIRQWERGYANHRNTSVLTRDNPFLDLDITDEAAVNAARDLVLERYDGKFIPLRIGNAPKCGFLFQISGAPFAKIVINLIAPDGREHRIEFLADGNQVVVHGIHPEIHRPYTWHGGSPFEFKHDDLSGITAQEAQRLVDDIVDLLIREFGYQIKGAQTKTNGAHGEAPDWYDRIDNLNSHDDVIALVMKLQRSGMHDDAVVGYVRALIERYAPDDDPERKARRLNDVPRAVRDGRAKIGKSTTAKEQKPPKLSYIRASEITMTAIEWLWPNRFALGKLGIIAGLPEEGKGQVVYDIVARVTRGDKWPLDEGVAPLGNVIFLTAEDDLADTVVPRLVSAGADRDRVYFIKMIRDEKNNERMFSFDKDLPALKEMLKEIKDVALLIVDPMSAYLGTDVDAYRDTEVRAVLGPLTDLMQESKVAIITIMHFNKKTDINNALLRIANTLAFGAAARHVYACVDDADHERKLMVRAKNNLAAKEASTNKKSLAYRFEARMVGHDPVSSKEIWAPHICWDPEYVDVTATEAMNAATGGSKSPTARDEAKKFLTDVMRAEGMPGKEIQEHAKAEGISERTLFRAKGELGIVARRSGPDGEWVWYLPSPTWHGDGDERD